jgi:hypothetical protein
MANRELKIVGGNFLPSPNSETPNFTLAELERENTFLREQAVNIMLELVVLRESSEQLIVLLAFIPL